MKKQVDANHYRFGKYCKPDRWASYWCQLNEIISANPQSVLEVGPGDNVVANYIREHTPIKYTTADLAQDLKTDLVADVLNLPLADNSFSVCCAFEVLEHLPWEKVPRAVDELRRVAHDKVIISLPHWGRHFAIDIRLPFFKRLKGQYKVNLFPIEHKFNGQHYWEIGKKNYPLKKVVNLFEQSGLKLERHYIPQENPYHHFFVLKK